MAEGGGRQRATESLSEATATSDSGAAPGIGEPAVAPQNSFEPAAAPEPAVTETVSVSLSVDLAAEHATITNTGRTNIDLRGWELVSLTGDQRMKFVIGQLQAGRWAEAEDNLLRILARRPGHPSAHLHLAVARTSLGKVEEAREHFLEALDAFPEHPELRFNYGKLLAGQGRPLAALEQYEAALRLRPNLVTAHLHAGDAQWKGLALTRLQLGLAIVMVNTLKRRKVSTGQPQPVRLKAAG